MPVSFIEWREGGVEEVKTIFLQISWNGQSQGGDVLISSGRGAGLPGQVILFDYNKKAMKNKD